jgi:enterochelin esterase-like enzyme
LPKISSGFIDGKYRTLAKAESRRLAGHSMGGYGTMRIGMKRPDVFSSLYLLSPCCMGPRLGEPQDTERMARVEAVTSVAEIEKADFGTKAMLASAAAWSPNPANPPLFIDLPVKGGDLQRMVLAKWTANAPLAMVDSYVHNLRRIKALAMDAGNEDRAIAATVRELDEVLNNYKIDHFSEIYEGNHVNRIGERIDTKALPFFSKNLSFK